MLKKFRANERSQPTGFATADPSGLSRHRRERASPGLSIQSGASFRQLSEFGRENVDWELSRAEIAYLLDREHEGRGLMSEALGLILKACFDLLGLNKVFLRTIVGNDRSTKLAERFGFVKEGVLREEFLTLDNRRVDLNYFGMLSSEFNHPRRGGLPWRA